MSNILVHDFKIYLSFGDNHLPLGVATAQVDLPRAKWYNAVHKTSGALNQSVIVTDFKTHLLKCGCKASYHEEKMRSWMFEEFKDGNLTSVFEENCPLRMFLDYEGKITTFVHYWEHLNLYLQFIKQ